MKRRNNKGQSAQDSGAMRAILRRKGLLNEAPVSTKQVDAPTTCDCGGPADFFAGPQGRCKWLCSACFKKTGGDPE